MNKIYTALNITLMIFALSGCKFGFMNVSEKTSSNASTNSNNTIATSLLATKLYTLGPSTGLLRTCTGPYEITTRSKNGVESGMNQDQVLNLAASQSSSFFSDAGCTQSITTVTVPKQQSRVKFYVKGNMSLPTDVYAEATGFESIKAPVNVRRVLDHFKIASPSSVTYGLCYPNAVRIDAKDIEGLNFASGAPVTVTVNGTNLKVYTDTNCTTEAPAVGAFYSLTIPSVASSVSFSVKATTEGSFNMTAAKAGIVSGTGSIVIDHIPTDLSYNGFTNALSVGICSGAMSVTSRDGLGVAYRVSTSAPTTIAISSLPLSGGVFYSGAGCTGSTITSVTIASNASTSGNFYYRTNTNVTLDTITASLTGVNSAVGNVTLERNALSLRFSTLSGLDHGRCSGAITVTSLDGQFPPQPFRISTSSTSSIGLLAASGGSFYNNSNCTGAAISSTPINANSSVTGSFYFKSHSTAQTSDTITASIGGLTSATGTINLTRAAINLRLNGITSLPVGVCSGALSVTSLDGANPAVAFRIDPSLATTVTLASLSASGGNFYSAPNCTGSTTNSVSIAGNAHTSSLFYYKTHSVVTSDTLTASVPAALNIPAVSSLVSLAQTALALRLNALPDTDIGRCSAAITATSLDGQSPPLPFRISTAGSTAITLSSNSGSFYSTSNCTGSAIPSINMAANQSTTPNFYYKTHDNTITSDLITVSTSGLSDASGTINLTRAAIALRFNGVAPLSVGVCSGAISLSSLDGALPGDPFRISTVDATPVTLGLSSTGGAFYSGVGCTGAIVTGVTIPLNGHTSESVYYKTNSIASATETITASVAVGLNIPNLNQSFNLNRAALSIELSSLPSLRIGKCSNAITVNSKDGQNPAVNYRVSTSASTTINFSTSNGGQFFTTSNCTGTAVTSTTIPANSFTSVARYYKTNNALLTSDLITVSSTGLTGDSGGIALSRQAIALSMTSIPNTVIGRCSGAFTVSSIDGQDPAQNFRISASAETIVTMAATSGSFYSDATCSNLISVSNPVTIGANQTTTAAVHYKTNSNVTTDTITASVPIPLDITDVSGSITLTRAAIALVANVPSTIILGRCEGITANSVDGQSPAANYRVSTSTATQVNFSANTGLFYSNSICTTPATSVSIPLNGVVTPSIYYKVTSVVGSDTITVTSTGLDSNSASPNISRQAIALKFNTPLPTVNIGQCSFAFNLSSLDGAVPPNVYAVPASPITVSVSESSGQLYSDANCLTPVSSTTIAANGTTSGNLHFKSTDFTNTVSVNANATLAGQIANAVATNISASRQALVLDTQFSGDGKFTQALGSAGEGLAMAYQSVSSKFVVVGYAGSQATMARFSKQGVFDAAFGVKTFGTDSKAKAVAINASGEIFVAGTTGLVGSKDFFISKFDQNGNSLNYATQAVNTINIDFGTSDDELEAMAFSGTNLVAVGSSLISGVSQFAVMIMNSSNGSVTSKVNKAAGGSNEAYGKALAFQGTKIIVAGSARNGANMDFAVYRFTSAGADDPTFNTAAMKLLDFGSGADEEVKAVAVQSNKLVLAGKAGTQFGMARLDSTNNANLDSTFGSSGLLTHAALGTVTEAKSVLVDASGNIVNVGNADNNMYVMRTNSNGGAIETGLINFSPSASIANACLLNDPGVVASPIVIGGTVGNDFGLVRLLP